MADSLNTGGNKQEMSMEMRLLVAFVLMGVVMYLSQVFFAPPPSSKKVANANPTTQTAPQSLPADKAALTTPAPPTPTEATTTPTVPAPNATPEKVEPQFIVQTDLYRVEFSNQGGTVRSWQLRKNRGNDGKPLELINTAAGLEYPFSLYFPGAKPTTDVNWKW